MRREHDEIKRDLQQRSYKVLPDKPLPLNAADFKNAVRESLTRSQLSVHLIGENYGVIPEAAECSDVYLQNELAAERSRDSTFTRLIWMPPGLQAKEERQQKFVEYLQNDVEAQHGAEILQTTLEDLKTVIQDKLNAVSSLAIAKPHGDGGPCRIYLICDQHDADEVITPIMEGNEAEVRAYHKDNLLLCDAILIYYGRAGEPWLRTKLLDLRKIAGYGRTSPLLAKAIYVAPPSSPQKERFRTLEAITIKNSGQFSPELLEPFLAQVENGARNGDAALRRTLTETTLRRSALGLADVVRQARLGSHENLLVVVDQFEELFRFKRSTERAEDAAAAFVKLLLEATKQTEVPVYVVT